MRELHGAARKELAALVEPFLRGHPLPGSFFGVPDDPMNESLDLARILGPLMALDLPGPRFDTAEGQPRTKLERLRDAGAAGAIFVRGPRSFVDAAARAEDALPDLARAGTGDTETQPLVAVQMAWKEADRLFRIGGQRLSALQRRIDEEGAPRSSEVDGVTVTLSAAVEPLTTPVPNVVSQISGGDLAHELVLLGAHYDHLGGPEEGLCARIHRRGKSPDEICNGADDNASGSAMVLEVARAVREAGVQPRRTLVFCHFGAEELGLLGSRALAEHPPWGDRKPVAMLNLDMVGRLGRQGLAIGGVGSSPQWMPLLDRVGAHGLSVLYERAVARRSDHASFYRLGIPVLFFFTGLHADYHRASDHVDKIDAEGMRAIAEIVAGILVELGDGHPIAWAEPGEHEGLVDRLPGDDPRTVEKRVAGG
jgi:hypothetical protein